MTASDQLVSVIVPVFNGERHIAEAVTSILVQTYHPLECIVVDESSTDGTAAVVESFGAEVLMVRKPKAGVSSARNAGAARAKGSYLAFLDADDVWLPEKLEKQMSLLRDRPDAGLVYTGLHVIDDEGTFIGRIDPPDPKSGLRNTLVLEGPGISVAQTGLVPAPVFRQLGGFDEELSTSADADFACRVAVGHPVLAVPEPLALYRHHAGQMHLDPSATERDMQILFEKLFQPGVLPPELSRLERRARANLHVSLAGKYIRQRDFPRFWLHVSRTLRLDPRRLLAAAKRLAISGGPRDFRWM